MADQQKTPRVMILDRFAASRINVDRLSIEETAGSVRVTGAVPTQEEMIRAIAVLGDAQAAGVTSTHDIEVRPAENQRDAEAPSPDILYPPEPA